MSIENVLEQFDKQFEAAESTTSGQTDLPEGKYRMTVSDVEIFTAKEKQTNWFKIILTVSDGDHKGTEISKLHSLDNPERFKFLKGDLATLGLHITKLSALPTEMKKVLGVQVNVQAKKKGEYTNYFINGRYTPTSESEQKGDVPF